jgi:hypothetical protein
MFFSFLPSFCKGSITIPWEHDVVIKCRLQGGKQKDLVGHYTHFTVFFSFYLENNLSMFKVQTLKPNKQKRFSQEVHNLQVIDYFKWLYFQSLLMISLAKGPWP